MAVQGADIISKKPNKKALQAQRAREVICEATIWCLDHFGYAETSINRIIDRAGVSRGALTHHFPSKEDLIVATLDKLLEGTVRRTYPGAEKATRRDDAASQVAVRNDLRWLYKMLNTREGRASMEILVASRTDKLLKARIAGRLEGWNRTIANNILRAYQAKHGGDDEAVLLWDLARVFMRGLLLHERYESDPARLEQLADRFTDMMAPHFQLRAGNCGPEARPRPPG